MKCERKDWRDRIITLGAQHKPTGKQQEAIDRFWAKLDKNLNSYLSGPNRKITMSRPPIPGLPVLPARKGNK